LIQQNDASGHPEIQPFRKIQFENFELLKEIENFPPWGRGQPYGKMFVSQEPRRGKFYGHRKFSKENSWEKILLKERFYPINLFEQNRVPIYIFS